MTSSTFATLRATNCIVKHPPPPKKKKKKSCCAQVCKKSYMVPLDNKLSFSKTEMQTVFLPDPIKTTSDVFEGMKNT